MEIVKALESFRDEQEFRNGKYVTRVENDIFKVAEERAKTLEKKKLIEILSEADVIETTTIGDLPEKTYIEIKTKKKEGK